jgi:hypothetical protein
MVEHERGVDEEPLLVVDELRQRLIEVAALHRVEVYPVLVTHPVVPIP